MKKILLSAFSIAIGLSFAHGQATVLSADFQTDEEGFTSYDQDGLTPNPSISFMNTWVRVTIDQGVSWYMGSTSDYTTAGAADDWMASAALNIPATGTAYMQFDARATGLSAGNTNGSYKVYVSTTGNTVADFTDAAVLDVPNEVNDGSWSTREIDLSSYAGQTIYVAFQNYTTTKGIILIDNIVVGTRAGVDASISSIDYDNIVTTATMVDLDVNVTNIGASALTSFDVTVDIDGTTYTDNVTGVNVATGETYVHTHSKNIDANVPGVYTATVTVENPNSTTDANVSDNSFEVAVNYFTEIPVKKVLVEEATGAWCGWCVDGALRLNAIVDANENAIGVAVHNGDAMVVPAVDNAINVFIGGYPSGVVDRYKFPSDNEVGLNRGLWAARTATRLQEVVPVSVETEAVYNDTTKEITITVTADFVGQVSGDYRFNAYVVEDKVTGSGSGYDQVNYYSSQYGANGGNDPNHPHWTDPATIVGYEHNHVLRAALGGGWGTAQSLPTTITAGSTYSKEYTYTLPAGYKLEDIHVVGFVQKYSADVNDREILNADETAVGTPTSIKEFASIDRLAVYPNPSNGDVTISYNANDAVNVTVEIVDITGKVVFSEALGNVSVGEQNLSLDLQSFNSGFYFVNIKTNTEVTSQKLTILK